jgi:hypothetical protein
VITGGRRRTKSLLSRGGPLFYIYPHLVPINLHTVHRKYFYLFLVPQNKIKIKIKKYIKKYLKKIQK